MLQILFASARTKRRALFLSFFLSGLFFSSFFFVVGVVGATRGLEPSPTIMSFYFVTESSSKTILY